MSDYVIPEQRIDLLAEARDVYRAMAAFDRSIDLDPELRELVKIRASQLNGCAFCLDLHLSDSREMGIGQQRLDTLAGWHDSPFFTARERAALALTEAITRLADGPVPDAVYAEAERHFDPPELAQLIMAIVAINSWNRIAVTSQKRPPTRAVGAA
jgi:AhpD family alkylhydroperoxidase